MGAHVLAACLESHLEAAWAAGGALTALVDACLLEDLSDARQWLELQGFSRVYWVRLGESGWRGVSGT